MCASWTNICGCLWEYLLLGGLLTTFLVKSALSRCWVCWRKRIFRCNSQSVSQRCSVKNNILKSFRHFLSKNLRCILFKVNLKVHIFFWVLLNILQFIIPWNLSKWLLLETKWSFYLVYLKTSLHHLIRKQRYFKIPPF